MAQRKSCRKRWKLPRAWRGWRRPGYKHLHTLHLHEERIVLAVLIERGYGNVGEWCSKEPARWNPRYLSMTFARLNSKRLADRSVALTSPWRGWQYTPTPEKREKAA